MNIEIINEPLSLDVYGFSGTALGKDYAGTAFKLMDKMWQVVKSNNIATKGQNIWIYEPDEKVFAGIELEGSLNQNIELELKKITFHRHAYYKHIGPYHLIRKAGQDMRDELQRRNEEVISPYLEIYGHWTNDETKLETELLMAIG